MDLSNLAKDFVNNLPYKSKPFSSRNWGHSWHSLCSYHGKLKPSIAHFLVKYFSMPGDFVLDPLSGVGTIPFEASLQGRIGIGNDLSKLAYVVTKAKLEKVNKENVLKELKKIKIYINNNIENINDNNLPYKDFGFNGKIPFYFHKYTYKEILCARNYFKDKINTLNSAESILLSCLLHVLHGNRPYALSRNSHPLTPYAPKGEYVYKNLIEHVENKIELSYKKGEWEHYNGGISLYGNYLDIPTKIKENVDVIICSPPFLNSIRFYINNWLRLWFIGWEPEDFNEADFIFLEGQQKKNLDIYYSFFEMCNSVLKENGNVILHLGKSKKVDMAEELSKRATNFFIEVYRGSESVEQLEKHGIRDKGSTVEHQYLFLAKR